MQERHLYEYAVIRFVPKVEREEFINMGIVLFSKQAKYLKSLYTIDENKLKLFSSELDINCLKEGLQVFDKICMGNKEGGAIANMDIPDRFRWLTAVKSSCIQVSRPHPGFSTDLDKTLDNLFVKLTGSNIKALFYCFSSLHFRFSATPILPGYHCHLYRKFCTWGNFSQYQFISLYL